MSTLHKVSWFHGSLRRTALGPHEVGRALTREVIRLRLTAESWTVSDTSPVWSVDSVALGVLANRVLSLNARDC